MNRKQKRATRKAAGRPGSLRPEPRGAATSAVAAARLACVEGPADPEAHLSLGRALQAAGQAEEAASVLTRALALKPDFAPAYVALAELLERQGNLAQAAESLALACQYQPDNALLHFELGRLCKTTGRITDAIQAYARAVEIDPQLAAGHVNLGNIALDHGRSELAIRSYRRALEADPGLIQAYSNLGKALMDAKRLDEALDVCQQGHRRDKNFPDLLVNYGNVLVKLGRSEEAVPLYERAIARDPERAAAYFNLGDACHELRRLDEAIANYERALARDPQMANAHNNMALVLYEQGRLEEAREHFKAAVELKPDHSGYRASLGNISWELGDRATYWKLADAGFESGLRTPNRRFERIPRWRGEPLEGKTLLIWREQGIGDEINFAKTYPQAIAAAGRCVIEAEPRLVSLFQRSFPDATVVPEDQSQDATRADADYQIPAWSLLEHFPDEFNVFRHATSYIRPMPALVEKWRQRLDGNGAGRAIGICWRSGFSARLRDNHYAPLADWAPLFELLPGALFVNLQYGDSEEELRSVEAAHGVRILRWDDLDLKNDMEDIFALASNLDLIVSAPTAVAEVGVSLGVPTWIVQSNAAKEVEVPLLHLIGYLDGALAHTPRIRWRRHWTVNWLDHMARVARNVEGSLRGGDQRPRRHRPSTQPSPLGS